MSSAHRPTWDPAKGRADERHKTARVSSRDMPSHTKLKFRQPRSKPVAPGAGEGAERRGSDGSDRPAPAPTVDAERAQRDGQSASANEGHAEPLQSASDLSSDSDEDERSGSADGGSDEEEDSDEDEEDDTAALMRELEKIKRERAEEKMRLEQERAEMDEQRREEEIALGNPLLNLEHALKREGSSSKATDDPARQGNDGSSSGGYGVKRRWDDDSIFRNQAAVGADAQPKTGFVNDLTRSEFHKKFMQRYVR